MTDLINRFRKPKHSASPSPSRRISPNRFIPLTSPASLLSCSVGSPCGGIGQLQSMMRKNQKKQVSVDVVGQQMLLFQTKQREMLAKKMFLIAAITIPLVLLPQIEGNALFCLAMLVIAYLLPSQAMSISKKHIISNSLKLITPLLYNVEVYYLMKSDELNHDINWVFAFLSLLATSIHCAMRYYKSIFLLASTQTVALAVSESTTIRKWIYFPRYICQKYFFIAVLAKNLIVLLLMSGFMLAGLFGSMDCFQWQFFRPLYLLKMFLLFFSLELYLQAVDFINQTTVTPLQIIKDKVPIFLNLLRLNNKPECWPIHRQCLRSLYMHTHKTPFYLSTETWKSLIYKTYMDIFNQYAEIELQRIHNLITKTFMLLKDYQKMMNSTKTPSEDLFIYFRKIMACFLAEGKAVDILNLLADCNFLFIISAQVEHQAAQGKEFIRVSQKVRDLMKGLRTQLTQGSKLSILSGFTRSQMMINCLRLSSWVFEMENEST